MVKPVPEVLMGACLQLVRLSVDFEAKQGWVRSYYGQACSLALITH